MSEYILQFDGASRGNPGKAASAFVVLEYYTDSDGNKKRKVIYKFPGIYLGIATNNQAEYMGLFLGLRFIYDNSNIQGEEKKEIETDLNNLHIEGDSELIIKQLKGEYKVKDPDLKKIYDNVIFFIKKLNVLTIKHIYREYNKIADSICNQVLDKI
jgi:ribonuclease HI